MGVLRSTQSRETELKEFREVLLRGGSGVGSAVLEGNGWKSGAAGVCWGKDGEVGDDDGRMVCVTSGVSFIGFAIVNRLLACGYTVRLALESQEDLEKVREMEMFGEMGRDGVWAVMANVTDLDSLCRAFDGCSGVFHTSAFTDPSGVSGYSKHMAELEVRAAERVIEACVRTESVRKCVFTSSLMACVWRQSSPLSSRLGRLPTVVDETCWSDETLCRDKKLWFALGKTVAEKAAWRAARGRNLKLATLCPALITGLGFSRRNSTGSIAYLKGAQQMLAEGLLATVDVGKAAEAHVCVYKSMSGTACGRYICFDHVIRRSEEAAQLERQLGIPSRISTPTVASTSRTDHLTLFELCNRKLSRLLSASRRCSYDTYSVLY